MSEATDRLKLLDGRRFTAGAVMHAAEIDQNTLTNYLSKTKLDLCSETAGQGRARKYCLVDAYQIALLYTLSKLTGTVAWSVGGLDYLLFSEQEFAGVGAHAQETGKHFFEAMADDTYDPDRTYENFKSEVCDRLSLAPKYYHERDILNPYYIFIDFLSLKTGRHFLDCAHKDEIDSRFADGGILWNLTSHLNRLDKRLCEYLEAQRSDA